MGVLLLIALFTAVVFAPAAFSVNAETGNVAKIGTTEYSTLQAAIDAAGTTQTEIVLINDINLGEGKVTVGSGKKITLDLNGKTIEGLKETKATSNHELVLVSNGGELTIKDTSAEQTGTIKFEYTGESTNYGPTVNTITNEQATLIIESGNFYNYTNVAKQISYVIDALTNGETKPATTTINGGKVHSLYYIAVRAFANGVDAMNSIEINGGDFLGRVQLHDANDKDNNSTITITDGTFTANDCASEAVYLYGNKNAKDLSVNISGGTFNGDVYFTVVSATDTDLAFNSSITGGTYNGEVWSCVWINGEDTDIPVIEGGTFTTDISNLVSDGFDIVQNEDGTFGADTVTNLSASVLGRLDAKKAEYAVNEYTTENQALIDGYYATAKTAIENAATGAEMDSALATFVSNCNAVQIYIPTAEYIADLRVELDKIFANSYWNEEKAEIEKLYEDAKIALESATTRAEMESILASFKSDAAKVEPIDMVLMVVLCLLGVAVLVVGAITVVIVWMKRKHLKYDDSRTVTIVTYEADDEESAAEETAPVVEEKAEETVPIEDDSVATVEEDRTEIAEEGAPVEESKRSDTTEEEFKALPKAKTFEEKLAAGDEKTKEAYEAITEKLNGYKKVKSRRSRRAETYKVGRAHIVKLQFSGKSIRCYLALNPADYDEKKLKHKDMSNKRSCVKTPMMMKLRSKKAIKNTLALIDEIVTKLELKPKKK